MSDRRNAFIGLSAHTCREARVLLLPYRKRCIRYRVGRWKDFCRASVSRSFDCLNGLASTKPRVQHRRQSTCHDKIIDVYDSCATTPEITETPSWTWKARNGSLLTARMISVCMRSWEKISGCAAPQDARKCSCVVPEYPIRHGLSQYAKRFSGT